MNKFIVINARTGPSHRPYVHGSLAEAQEEAGRISISDPGAKVYVMQAIGYMQHNKGTWHGGEAGDRRDTLRGDCLELSSKRYADLDDETPF